jgi:RHS repeat-associated protein
MNIFSKSYPIFILAALLCCLSGISSAQAQNVPTLSITQPSGSVTGVALPPAPVAVLIPANERTYVPKVPMQTVPNDLSSAATVSVSTVYKDGFSRPMQTVQHNAAYSGSSPIHLVQPADSRFQSSPLSFLPYPANSTNFNTNMFTAQRDYYYGKYPGEYYTAASQEIYISDANQRATKAMMPGKSQIGQNRGVVTKQITNGPNDLRMWITLANGEPDGSVNYPDGSVFGEQVTDSTGAEVMTYTNKEGKIVCQRVLAERNPNPVYMYTYYAYDDMGRLRWVLPHKAVVVSLGTLSQEVKDNLCFRYKYDEKGRMVERKMPGKAVEEFIYDKRDRLVFYRDGILKAKNQWRFTLYDPKNRPTVAGVATDPISRIDLLNYVNDANPFTPSDILYYVKNYNLWNAYPTSISISTILSYTYYDDYIIADPTGAFWDTYASVLQLDVQSIPGAEIPVRSKREGGQMTGSKVRILPTVGADSTTTGTWRQSVFFYDDKGRQIYSYSQDSYNNGSIIHRQYHGTAFDFINRSLITKHITNNLNSTDGHPERTELYRNLYDPATGQLTQTMRKVGAGPWSISTMYSYDEMGKVKRKVLGNYGEVQDMNYNIRGQLLGINGTYAETGDKEGESRTFGELLRYDYGFTQPKYDGKIAGMAWRGSSTANNVAMAYGYSYDLSGRLKQADFRLRDAGVWGNNLADYSVSNLTYDGNGNIRTMTQKATKAGVGIITMDNLSYLYEGTSESSNRLQRVSDAITNTGTYGLGDFQDGSTGTTDYTYDSNGNLTSDMNKGISGISYNDQNKPEVITFSNGNTISYSYDAQGAKVQERSKNGSIIKVTDYLSNYVYEDNKLKMVSTPEGRSIPAATGPEEREEFFVQDHLGNIRSVIDVYTYPIKQYLATYEVASAGLEGLFFDYHNEIRDDNPSSPAPSDLKSGRLNGADPARRVGTALVLKVMAGDKVEMDVNTFFEGYDMDQENPVAANTMMNSIISTLTAGAGGWPTPGDYHNPLVVQDLFNTNNYINAYQSIKQSVTDNSRPRAYLNYILFDEDMKIVSEMSGAYQATGNGTWATVGTSNPMTIPASGFLAVYLSNETQNIACANCADVYFDQLSVRVTEGKLKEESHYYPHGLPIAGMGSAASGFVENKKRYQGNDFNRELGLNWMDFHNRQYDPQIGRFLSVDPKAEVTLNLSPYMAMNNDPVSLSDPLGLFAGSPNLTYYNILPRVDGSWIAAMLPSVLRNASRLYEPDYEIVMMGMTKAMVLESARHQTEEVAATMLNNLYGTGAFSLNSNNSSSSSEGQDQQLDNGAQDPNGWKVLNWGNQTFEYKMQGNNYNDQGSFGVMFEMYTKGTSEYKNVDFIQSVLSNSPIDIANGNSNEKRWDGDSRNPNKPFYFSKANRLHTISVNAIPNKYSNYFKDSPGRYRGNESYFWFAELSLVGKQNGQYQNIATFTWGYIYFNRMAIPFGPLPTYPSDFQKSLINSAK